MGEKNSVTDWHPTPGSLYRESNHEKNNRNSIKLAKFGIGSNQRCSFEIITNKWNIISNNDNNSIAQTP